MRHRRVRVRRAHAHGDDGRDEQRRRRGRAGGLQRGREGRGWRQRRRQPAAGQCERHDLHAGARDASGSRPTVRTCTRSRSGARARRPATSRWARTRPPPARSPRTTGRRRAGRYGRRVPVRGTVRIKVPGGTFRVLREGDLLPNGTTIDTLRGRVTLIAAANRSGRESKADFYDGVFKLRQSKGSPADHDADADREAELPEGRQRERGGQEEEAPPVGRRQRQVPHEGQAQRRDGASAPSGWWRIAAPPRSPAWSAAACRCATSKPRRRSSCARGKRYIARAE